MSYYYNEKYNFSDHALARAKDRLKLKGLNNLEVKDYCLKLIESSIDIQEIKTNKYIRINNTNLYFVVNNVDNLIITLTPIKPDRLLSILENY